MTWNERKKELPEYIKRKNYHMALFISLAIGIEGLVMIFIAIRDSNFPVIISTVLYSSLMFITFFHILLTKKLRFFYVSGSLMVIALTVWFLYSGGTEGFGITWLLVIPLFTIYLMPYPGFIFLNTVVLILFEAAMWGPFISKGLGIYDISGHGISSGIITLLAKNLINQEFYENQNTDIIDVVNKINERFIIEKGELENYITGILLRLGKKKAEGGIELEFVNAGHQPPVLYHKKDDSLEILKNTKDSRGAIGLNTIQPNYIVKNICMEAGDELILYTDGVTDCVGAHKKELTLHGFTDLIVENISKNVDEQLKYILTQISAFRGEEAAKDDMTIIIMRYTGN